MWPTQPAFDTRHVCGDHAYAGSKDNVLAVPLEAVNHSGDQTTVYIVSPAGKVEDRAVTLGLQSSTEAEVVSGLPRANQ